MLDLNTYFAESTAESWNNLMANGLSLIKRELHFEPELRYNCHEGYNLQSWEIRGKIRDVNFTRSNLTGCFFLTRMRSVNFTQADLRSSKFQGSAVRTHDYPSQYDGLIFTRACLDDTLFEAQLVCCMFSGASMLRVSFAECSLRNCIMVGCDLQGANFMDANLKNVDLRRANLNGANFKGACLEDVCLDGADTTDAVFD